jgi:hypothetical protein
MLLYQIRKTSDVLVSTSAILKLCYKYGYFMGLKGAGLGRGGVG